VGRVPSCLLLRFGVVKLMSNVLCLTSLHQNLISICLYDILRYLEDITFTYHLRTKCLLRGMEFSWRKISFPKESVGVKFNSKKFEINKQTLNLRWKDN
jgi:hypothetical protein